MQITKLYVKNFRNYTEQSVDFSNTINILQGANAQGKTNFVEAACLCSLGRSPLAEKDRELVQRGHEQAYVRAEITRPEGDNIIEIWITKSQKQMHINGLPVLKLGELMGVLKTVFFSPSEIDVIRQSPADRRRFMDIDLCQMSKAYFYTINRYNKILLQRNNLLKTSKSKETILNTLPIWDTQLSIEGGKIMHSRDQFIKRILPHAEKTHAFLTEGKEKLSLAYQSQINGQTRQEYQQEFLNQLTATYDKDIVMGYTGIGAHRDDIKISVDEVFDLRAYGSQGQQRTAALSLKLAELELFYEMFNDYPILILDDVLSELDERRQRQLFKYIKNIQTLITATACKKSFLRGLDYKTFKVVDGLITTL